MPKKEVELHDWAAIYGTWTFDDEGCHYIQPDTTMPIRIGAALSDVQLRSGIVKATVDMSVAPGANEARVIFGYSSLNHHYYAAGLGGYERAYVIDEYIQGRGWQALDALGNRASLDDTRPHNVLLQIRGQRVSMQVDGIPVLEHQLIRPLPGNSVGLLAVGPGPVDFTQLTVSISSPRVFIVMEFDEPYNSIYKEVIVPVCEQLNYSALRADNIHRPGIILQDIVSEIIEAEVVIAEITPPDPNVFYELGYSHALSKNTILLAEQGKDLPFDVQGYRCIFYSNTIRGKRDVETELRRHLEAIKNGT